MTPLKTIAFTCLLVVIAFPGRSNNLSDSISILQQDSIAYKIYLSYPDSSISLAEKSLQLSVLSNNNYVKGFSLFVLSKANWAKGNYRLSADHGYKALKIFENTSHTKLWSKTLLSLARTFIDLRDYKQGAEYIRLAILLSRQINDEYTLGEAYREKSMLFSETGQYDSALFYSDAGLKIFAVFKDSVSESILFSRKAKVYFIQKNFTQSDYYNRKALRYDSLIGNTRALGIAYFQSARDAVQFAKYDSAILLLKKSRVLNERMHNIAALVKVHSLFAEIFEKQKKQNLAIQHLQLAGAYKDTLYNAERSGKIAEMQSLYDLAAKQQTIEFLEKDNKFSQAQVKLQRLLVGVLLTCVILAGVAIFFLQRYRRLQEKTNRELEVKNKSIEQQKEEIQSQAETLQELNNLKSKLFSVISHDLRGPMATLHAILDLLLRKHMTPEEFISVAEKLKFSMDVTERTLENLLNWSLSQMEGIKAEPRTIDISQTIAEACTLMIESAERKNVSIDHKIKTPMLVNADEDQVMLILRNLIHNAIKFSKPFNNVSVSAWQEDEFCYVSIKDTGIGMTKTEVETVISSKQHFSKTGTMQEKGTGLGLLLCHEFIKLNGGQINIKSNINYGTEVSFTLPLAPMNLN